MPILYPTGIAMMAELATYGIVAGFLYQRSRWQCLRALYRAIITAMVSGRAVWALAEIALLGISADGFTCRCSSPVRCSMRSPASSSS